MDIGWMKSMLLDRKDTKYQGRVLYQPIEHPAFDDWVAQQPCTERFKMMCEWLGANRMAVKTIVDIGSHTGWFCRQFARVGVPNVIGFERQADWHRASVELSKWFNLPGDYRHTDWMHTLLPQAEVYLMLSVIMYAFRDLSEEDAWTHIREVSTMADVMFMDVGGMYAHHCPFAPTHAAEAIVANTDFTEGHMLGTTDLEMRPFYVFKK